MFILQGTWMPQQDQTSYFFLWIEHKGPSQHHNSASTTSSSSRTEGLTVSSHADVIDHFMFGVNAIVGDQHSLTLEPSQLSWSNIRQNLLSMSHNDQLMLLEDDPISGIAIPFKHGNTADALSLFMSFAASDRWAQWGFQLGQSLKGWQQAASLTIDLLASAHYMPSIDPERMLAVWDGVFDDPRIEHRLHALLRYVDNEQVRSALQHFITTNLDLFIRESMDHEDVHQMMKCLNPRYVAALTPIEHWWQGLFVHPADEQDPSLSWIAPDVQQWRTMIVEQHNEQAFRTCFRLVPPQADRAAEPSLVNDAQTLEKDELQALETAVPNSVDNDAPSWTLQVLLQAADEPSLLVPANIVWQQSEQTLHYLNYRFSHPQERLLADLGMATAHFSPIERLLKDQNPAALALTTEEAYDFLTSASAALDVAGFGIYVPVWWRNPTAQLGVRMKVRERGRRTNFNDQQSTKDQQSTLGFAALLDYEWELSIGDEEVTLSELEYLTALKQPLIQFKGQWIELHPQYIDEAAGLLQVRGTLTLADLLHVALAYQNQSSQAVIEAADLGHLLYDDAQHPDLLAMHGVMAEGAIEQMIKGLTNDQPPLQFAQPAALKGRLRPYQFKGFSWLMTMRELKMGSCLADDMGLGKTIQYLAYLLALKERQMLTGPALLICPTSVVDNWELECQRFAPSVTYWVHHGPDRLQDEAFASQTQEVDLIITTYAIVRRDELLFTPLKWDHITLDEAQHIKNPAAQQTQSIRKLKAHHRIALTGTPIENRLSELWSIMDFLNPGYLGTREQFARQFELPIEQHDDRDQARLLQRMVQPFLLRRLKSDRKIITDLPNKQELTVPCPLTKEQISLYEACIHTALDRVDKTYGMERRGIILATITHLKQICNHPAHYLGEGALDIKRSGKMMKLIQMLQEVRDRGERALVFTQYARMGMILQRCLSEYFRQEVFLIHGQIPRKKRDELIRRFQEADDAPFVFVLSLKTGGFGLNLTRANHVIHYDRWWNPAVENQATDRAFRIGQERHVTVHKFICTGTLEERIDQLMHNKQSLAENVVGKGEAWITEMSTTELKQLMALRQELFTAN